MAKRESEAAMAQVSDNTEHTGEEPGILLTHQPVDLRERLRCYASQPWLICIVLCLLALTLNIYRLDTPSIWFDEAFSVELASRPLPLLWHIIFGPEANMELYYLFLHFWLLFTSALGVLPTESIVRFPSAIFATLATGVIFALGRRFLGTRIATVATTLYLLNDVQLVYAQQTRSYALQLLFLSLAWYALYSALLNKNRQRRWWIAYIITMSLAVYTHLFSLLILLAQIVAITGLLLFSNKWQDYVRKQVLAFAVSIFSIGVLIIPMLLESQQGAKTGWLTSPRLPDLYHLFIAIGGASKVYFLIFLFFMTFGLVVVFRTYFYQYNNGYKTAKLLPGDKNTTVSLHMKLLPFAWSIFCWFIVPLVVSYLISLGSLRLFSTRYLVTIVPPLLLLVALGIAVIRSWRLQALLAIALIIFAALAVPHYYQSAQVEDWNASTHWLLQRYHAGDGLVCYDNEITQGCQIAITYYLHAYPKNGAQFSDDAPGAFSWQNYGPVDPQSGYNAALDSVALTNYASRHTRFFYIVGRVPDDHAASVVASTQQWLRAHYQIVDHIVTPTVTINLYQQP